MARIFTIQCPGCKREFDVHYQDLRFTGIALLCPYCGYSFLPDESEKIDDRW